MEEDDFFGPGGSPEAPNDGLRDAELRALEERHFSLGYLEGVERGKTATRQAGFDVGFAAGLAQALAEGERTGAAETKRGRADVNARHDDQPTGAIVGQHAEILGLIEELAGADVAPSTPDADAPWRNRAQDLPLDDADAALAAWAPLNAALRQARVSPGEGYLHPVQARWLCDEVQRRQQARGEGEPLLLLEVGFCGGHSAAAMLSASAPDSVVVSFDLATHLSCPVAAAHLAGVFPRRHELVAGDSRVTVPLWARQRKDRLTTADLVLVDGGHSHDEAAADLRNLRALAGPGTVLVVDDVVPEHRWGRGPSEAWLQAEARGEVTTDAVLQVRPVSGPIRRWVVGRYRWPSTSASSEH